MIIRRVITVKLAIKIMTEVAIAIEIVSRRRLLLTQSRLRCFAFSALFVTFVRISDSAV